MEVHVLGELEVMGPDGGLLEVSGARLRRLVTRLAVDADRVVGGAELVDAVWGDRPPADPVGALQTLVSRLRRVLGRPSLVQQAHHGYRLVLAPADVDIERFRRLVRDGRSALAAGDAATARSALDAGLSLWRGAALTDAEDADYAVALTARLEEERLDALGTRIDADLQLGHAAQVVAELQDLARAHPLREQLAGQLMRALAAAGRGAEALAAYEQLRTTLADTLGSDPSPGLRDLHLRLLRQEEPPASGRPDPEPARRTTLRPGLTSFLGRAVEQGRVVDLLAAGRLVTVVGPGGAGKTRMATEVGRAWPSAHGGGAALVELAPVRDESGVVPAFLAALGLRETHVLGTAREARRATDDVTLLIDAVAAGPYLLVVDNCEHLLDAGARLVEELLASCPQLRVLATSREPLGVDGESLCVLPPLGLPPWGVALADAPSYASVQLFVERASAVRSGPVLDRTTLASVVEIVRRLDGLPLAIELAAARTRVLPVTEIAARLSDRFRLLTGGRRTALPRHQTLRAVVEWSWELLTPDERLLAERLAVFPAGSTTASASAVCADGRLAADEMTTLLGSLVDKSLLTVDESGGLRYRMLETIREFGVDRLAERGEVEQARLRHASYFADLVSRETGRLYGLDQVEASRFLEAERDNVVAAIRYLGDSGDAERTLRMVLELSWWWSLLGAPTESRTWLSFAVDIEGDVPPGARELAQAMLLMARGMDEDDSLLQDGLTAEAGAASDRLEQLELPEYARREAVVSQAMLAFFGRRPDRSKRLLDSGLRNPDPWVRAAMRMLRAALAENDGDVAGVRRDVDAAYEEFSRVGDRWGLASVLSLRARLQAFDGDVEGAIASLEQSADRLGEIGARSDRAFTLMRTAALRLRLGDIEGARRDLDRFDSDVDGEGFGHIMGLTFTGVLAALEHDEAELHEARQRLLTTLESGGSGPGRGHGRALVLTALVQLDIDVGDLAAALEHAPRAYRSALGTDDMPVVAGAGCAIALVAVELGRHALAAELLGAAARVRGADDPTELVVARVREAARQELGASAYTAAYERGWSLPKPEAVARLDPADWAEPLLGAR